MALCEIMARFCSRQYASDTYLDVVFFFFYQKSCLAQYPVTCSQMKDNVVPSAVVLKPESSNVMLILTIAKASLG